MVHCPYSQAKSLQACHAAVLVHLPSLLLLSGALLALVREVGQRLPSIVHDLVRVLDDFIDV